MECFKKMYWQTDGCIDGEANQSGLKTLLVDRSNTHFIVGKGYKIGNMLSL